MRMVAKKHFITIKISHREATGGREGRKGKGTGRGAAAPLVPHMWYIDINITNNIQQKEYRIIF